MRQRLTFGPLGAWYGDTQLPFMGSHLSLSLHLRTYELPAGQILFQPQPNEGLTANESLLLLQHSLTGGILDKNITERARLKGRHFDSEGESQWFA